MHNNIASLSTSSKNRARYLRFDLLCLYFLREYASLQSLRNFNLNSNRSYTTYPQRSRQAVWDRDLKLPNQSVSRDSLREQFVRWLNRRTKTSHVTRPPPFVFFFFFSPLHSGECCLLSENKRRGRFFPNRFLFSSPLRGAPPIARQVPRRLDGESRCFTAGCL